MNITREQMLERIREWKGAFDTHLDKMDEWSLCFMEDYKVYDAIRSLIESSGETENKEPGAGPRIFPSVGQNPTLGGPSPGPLPTPTIKKDLTVEVEEAIKHAAEFRLGLWVEFLKMPGLDKELDPLLWNESDEAALAVIRAALKCREENDKK